MLPTNRFPSFSTSNFTSALHVVCHDSNPAPGMDPNSVTLHFNSDSAPGLDHIISALRVYTYEARELHNAFRDELSFAFAFIKQKLSDPAHFTKEKQQELRQFAINAVIERCRRQEIQGVTEGQYQHVFVTLFPHLVKAVSDFLEQRTRVVININLDNQHYLFVDKTAHGIYLFYEEDTLPLMFLMLDKSADSVMNIDLSYQSLCNEQPCNSVSDAPGHPMQTRSRSLQQAATKQSALHSSQPFIQNKRQVLLQQHHQHPPARPHFTYSHIESDTNRHSGQLPPIIRQQPFPDFLPLSNTYAEPTNRAIVQQLIGDQYNQSCDAANNLMLWMIRNGGRFPPTDRNIDLISLTFKPNDYVAKIQGVDHIFFQFPAMVNLSRCHWEYSNTFMNFQNGTVMTSSAAQIWAVGPQACGHANGNGTVFLMRGARGYTTGNGQIKRMS